MPSKSPRKTSPRRWTGLALAGTAISVGMASLAEAEAYKLSTPKHSGLWHVQAEGGEGGEGGEAGAVADMDVETAYLVRLAIVEGHLVAAADLYANGFPDEAIGLSYHPEAEMMDEVREGLAAHDTTDITPLMQAFSTSMEENASPENVNLALAAVSEAIEQAIIAESPNAKTQFTLIKAVAKAAAAEYDGSIEGGKVSDMMAYNEAKAFLQIAAGLAEGMLSDPDQTARAEKTIEALKSGGKAFGTVGHDFLANDPAILYAIAARVELIGSQVR